MGFTNALSVAEITANAQPVLADPSDPLHSGLTFMQQQGVDWSNTWYARSALMWNLVNDTKFMLTQYHRSPISPAAIRKPIRRIATTRRSTSISQARHVPDGFVVIDVRMFRDGLLELLFHQPELDERIRSHRPVRVDRELLLNAHRTSCSSTSSRRTRISPRRRAWCRRIPVPGTGSRAPTTAIAGKNWSNETSKELERSRPDRLASRLHGAKPDLSPDLRHRPST